jgi:hypothetical protein
VILQRLQAVVNALAPGLDWEHCQLSTLNIVVTKRWGNEPNEVKKKRGATPPSKESIGFALGYQCAMTASVAAR